jgi:hypothetical protein
MSTMDKIRPIYAKTTADEWKSGWRVRKRSSLGRTARYGLFGVTIWLLLEATLGVSQNSGLLNNLLAPKNGGQVIVATSDGWLKTIDGSEDAKKFRWDEWAIYVFKDEQTATFDTFAVLIPGPGTEPERIRVAGRK